MTTTVTKSMLPPSLPRHASPEAPPEDIAEVYRRVPLRPLSAVVDSLGTRFEALALQRAKGIIQAGAPQRSIYARLLGGSQALGSGSSLDARLTSLATRQREKGAEAVVAERQALRADLDAFAETSSVPSGLRLWDPEVRAERHRARYQANNATNLRLLRQAAAQMMERSDLADEDIINLDGMAILRLSQVAVSQMVFESMGGGTVGRSSTFITVSMDAMQTPIQHPANPVMSELAVGLRLSQAVADLADLDAIGRLRLREATYARLLCRPLPAALLAPTAPAEAAIPQAAERLAHEIASLTMNVPQALNKLVGEVFGELRSTLPAAAPAA